MIRHSLGFSCFHIRFHLDIQQPYRHCDVLLIDEALAGHGSVEVYSFVHGFDGIVSIRKWCVGVHCQNFSQAVLNVVGEIERV